MEQEKKIDNPPAFATSSPSCSKYDGHLQEGMTLRDYFAAKAMQGIMAHYGLPKQWNRENLEEQIKSGIEASYIVADAMLKERSK